MFETVYKIYFNIIHKYVYFYSLNQLLITLIVLILFKIKQHNLC